MASYRVISSSSRVFEPADLFSARLDSEYRDRVPEAVSTGSAPLPEDYPPEQHVKGLDSDGVEVSILYPNFAHRLYALPDSELLTVMFRTYNDWLAEYCNAFENRLKGIALLNVDDVPSSVAELERCANLGLVGAAITVYPSEEMSYESPEYNSLWAAAQEAGMPLSLHVGTNRPGPGQVSDLYGDMTTPDLVNADYWIRMSLSNVIFGGVFERYPKLRMVSVGHELSWAPLFVDRANFEYTQRPPARRWPRLKEDTLPSDHFGQNVFLNFHKDPLGIKDRHLIGVDRLLWTSNYPLQDSPFPRSQEFLEKTLAGCTESEKASIASGNAASLYSLG